MFRRLRKPVVQNMRVITLSRLHNELFSICGKRHNSLKTRRIIGEENDLMYLIFACITKFNTLYLKKKMCLKQKLPKMAFSVGIFNFSSGACFESSGKPVWLSYCNERHSWLHSRHAQGLKEYVPKLPREKRKISVILIKFQVSCLRFHCPQTLISSEKFQVTESHFSR